MPYCAICSTLTLADIAHVEIPYHPSLQSLKTNADAGCKLCHLWWTNILASRGRTAVDLILAGRHPDDYRDPEEEWDGQMWLDGSTVRETAARATGQLRSVPGSEIWLRFGSEKAPSPRLCLFAEPGTPAAAKFRGRFSDQTHNPNLHVDIIKTWLRTCQTSHRLCRASFSRDSPPSMPTRVIDVGVSGDGNTDHKVKLIVTNGMRENYIALSYCWGPPRAPGQEKFTLRSHTMDEAKTGVEEPRFAQAHQDCFQLARALGVRYVWVDALCIIQGSAEDWAAESARMGEVYGNALLTVVAGRSDDAWNGFVANKLEQKAKPCAIPVGSWSRMSHGEDKGDAGKVWLTTPRNDRIGPVDSRGWCFQELMLARRAVVFGEEQLSLRCTSWIMHEDGQRRWNELPRAMLLEDAYDTSGNLAQDDSDGEGEEGVENRPDRRTECLEQWYGALDKYTQRHLSNPHDIFAAMASVAARAHHVLDSRYIAGIWETDMVRGLMWRGWWHGVMRPARHRIPWLRPLRRPAPTFLAPEAAVIRSPSWSWAAVEGPVRQSLSRHGKRFLEDPDWIRLRPGADGGSWSADGTCGVGTMHMPSCTLDVIGRVGRVKKAPSLDMRDYMAALKRRAEPDRPERLRGAPGNSTMVERHGMLFLPRELETGDATDPKALADRVVAVGVFDVDDEARDEAWCLFATRGEGLMLGRQGDGRFHRLGMFVVDNLAWFEGLPETKLQLV